MYPAVTFHAATLVCEADPTIGCGCRAKQVIGDLEHSPVVEKAYLHRRGHVIAVVWRTDPRSPQLMRQVESILASRSGVVRAPAWSQAELDTFPDPAWWLGGSGVDRLSEDEARTIAARVMQRLFPNGLPGPDAESTESALAAGMRNVLIAAEDISIEARFSRMLEVTLRVLATRLHPQEFERVKHLVVVETLLPAAGA